MKSVINQIYFNTTRIELSHQMPRDLLDFDWLDNIGSIGSAIRLQVRWAKESKK